MEYSNKLKSVVSKFRKPLFYISLILAGFALGWALRDINGDKKTEAFYKDRYTQRLNEELRKAPEASIYIWFFDGKRITGDLEPFYVSEGRQFTTDGLVEEYCDAGWGFTISMPSGMQYNRCSIIEKPLLNSPEFRKERNSPND